MATQLTKVTFPSGDYIDLSGKVSKTGDTMTGNLTAPKFIGALDEANLVWGGKNFSASYGCIDAALMDELGANRFQFIKASAITVEYTRDGGTTWTDYGATDAQKKQIFAQGGSLIIGKADSTNKATEHPGLYQLRITIDTGEAGVYSVLNKFVVYVSTSGSANCACKIQKALQSTPTNFVDHTDWITISGWSGYNVLNTNQITTYGNSPSGQYGRVRFIFKDGTGGSTSYNGLVIFQIKAFGGVGWICPSTMAKSGHIYSYNENQDAIFPNTVQAPYHRSTTKMTVSNGKVTQLTSGHTMMFADGLAISNPTTANDQGWIRVLGTGESDTVLEIATGDDGGAGEQIVVRQYNTSSAIVNEATLLDKSGNTTFPKNVTATKFIGALQGNADTATSATTASSANVLNQNTRMDYGWNGVNYFNISGTAGAVAKTNDTPTTAWWHIMRFNHANSTGYYTDLAIPFNNNSIYYKRISAGSLQNNGWVKVLDELNYNDYAPKKDGTGASGTWGINISGTATSATTANYVSLIANNEIRLAGKPSTAQTVFMGYKWSDNTSAALINRWKFCNGNGAVAEVEASTFYGALSGNATSATTASKLGSSNVGSAIQPIYLSAGTATACTYTLGKSVPSDAVFTDTKYTAGDNMTLSSNTFSATKRWNAVTQGQKWSRIALVENTVATVGNSSLLHVCCTRGNVVCNATFLINTSHSSYGQITQIGANNYTNFKVRLVVNSSGYYYIEIYDFANSIASGTAQTWYCSLLSFQPATITAYTAFTDGTTVPSGWTANGEQETLIGSSALAIRNITRSGTTFTATRQNGTTFTFTQQDNDHYAWSDITSKPTTYAPTIGTTATTAMAGNTNVNNVTQTATTNGSDMYEVLFSATADNVTRNEGARKASSILVNPGASTIRAQNINNGGYTIDLTADFDPYIYINKSDIGLKVKATDLIMDGTNNTWDGTNSSLVTAVTNKLDKSGGTMTGDLITTTTIGSTGGIFPSVAGGGNIGDSTKYFYSMTARYLRARDYVQVLDSTTKYSTMTKDDITLAGNTWDGTNTSLKTAISSIPKVKVADYAFTFPSTATTYYEHYYYDVTYSNLNIPTTGITIINAFVANVTTNVPAFAQCVSSPNAFRVYSKYADIKGKYVTMRVIYI